MTYRAIDCQGFAGGFTLGVVQAGFELIAKREKRGGFGGRNCEANRHILGYDWTLEACDPIEWSVPDGGASLVFGNPPCSGFSVLSSKAFRGRDSKINQCMWDFVEYAARVRPEIAIFESVQLAFSQGRSLMQDLRVRLEELTGDDYHLYHVLHNALSVGGPAMRKRYFWVASRVPFSVEAPQLKRVPLLRDVIEDLVALDQKWETQRYWLEPTWYSRRLRDRTEEHYRVTDGHICLDTPHTRRTLDILDKVQWNPNEHMRQTTKRYYEEYGELPPSWAHLTEKLVSRDFFQGYQTPIMWHPDHHARVATGGALLHAVHWAEKRTFTHREVARVLGFPDSWLIEPLRGTPGLFLTWGKGITVDCGRWIAEWAKRSLDGQPSDVVPIQIGERESLFNVTNAWKTAGNPHSDTVDTTTVYSNLGRSLVTETATALPAAPETNEPPADGRRGRPRPTETVDRDQRIFDALASHGKSRVTLASELGIEPNLVYLSLWRMKRAQRVERLRHDGGWVWQRVAGAQ